MTLCTWIAVIVQAKGREKEPGAVVMIDARLKVRRFYSKVFLVMSLASVGIAGFMSYLEIPRIAGPFYNGEIVGFDATHPNAAHWEDPIVRVTWKNGKTVVFSNFGVYAQPNAQSRNLPALSIGEHVDVIYTDGRYEAMLYNDSVKQEIGFLVIFLTGAAVCGWMAFSLSRPRARKTA